MRTVALATHSGCPKLSADDQLLIPYLRDLDIEAKAVVWDNRETDWTEFDQVIIRSCWESKPAGDAGVMSMSASSVASSFLPNAMRRALIAAISS